MEVPYGRFLGNLLFLFCLPCALAAKKNREVCRHRSNRVDWLLPCYFLSCGFHFQHSRRSFPEFFATCVSWVIVSSFWWFVVCFPGFFLPWPHHVSFHFFPFTSKSRQDTTRSCKNPEKGMAELLVLNPHLTTTTRHVMVGITRSKVISFFALN